MKLSVEQIGKKFNRRWLFRDISFTLEKGQSMAVLGRNGAGKSTLLQIVFGLVQPSQGLVRLNGKSNFKPHLHFAMTAPYLELPLEFSASEILELHRNLNKTKLSEEAFMDFAYFSSEEMNRPLRFFSSGMGQRLKTALCLASDAEILLFDEPLTNMDQAGEKWFLNAVQKLENRICLVASNLPSEYSWTDSVIQLQ